ncbi:MAG: putative nucleic acid-binding Zn-ribbon protein [Nitrospinales bacterium]|jgi:predicted  nucleic acid-binding Zn-ribbon protein
MSVSPRIQLRQLVDLQKIDDQISEHNKALADIPRQLDSASLELEEKKSILKVVTEEIAALKKRGKDLELEVQGESDHMAKAKTKLPAVKTNKEYTAILTEVDAIKEKVSKIEDKELEVMEALEEKSKEIPGAEKKCKEEDAYFNEYRQKKETEEKRFKEELEELVIKRKNISEELETVILNRYQKISDSREGRAVAGLRGDICQGCFQHVLPQMVIEIKMGQKIHQCASCLSFLFWDEAPETSVPK